MSFGRCLGDEGTGQGCGFFNCFKSAAKEDSSVTSIYGHMTYILSSYLCLKVLLSSAVALSAAGVSSLSRSEESWATRPFLKAPDC